MFKKHVKQELSAYCHGELEPEDSRRVAEHLLGCERCRKEYDEIKLGVYLARRLSPKQAPAEMWSEIEQLLDRQTSKPAWRPSLNWLALPVGWPRLATVTAALLLVLGIGAVWYYQRLTRPAWDVEIATSGRVDTSRLAVGDLLVTDNSSRAKIEVGKIGEVEVEPNSRVRLVKARVTEHRLALDRGTMHARIWAPPRLFFVDTPSAEAVDYGCAYTLEVDDKGRSYLYVTLGWVALVRQGRESMVPAGAKCETRPGIGPGTPYFLDASEALIQALAKFDFENGGTAALKTVLAEAQKFDTLTLWHLLPRVNEIERGLIYDRMAALVPPPPEVTREGIIKLDQKMLDEWKNDLDLQWLREDVPIWRKAWRKAWSGAMSK